MAAPAILPMTMPAIAPPERSLCDEDELEDADDVVEDEPDVDVAEADVLVALAVVSTPAADVE
ncbi:hypothetical protein LTR10_014623 [Elasticomyces elasticus]|uniref:Uncharacterized protein n=1 Tax=Exophiala sideris TaxID=1016849 RepID=A0ABR0JSY6_9EURO|nr:hypothetical protein LTR10_014623 [Elasticomyces elasticus]KAK5040600.1 hypothetical protein LTS07_001100 [Exophiala sideris]KAK5068978.1 hypothetical protein LTR69_001101 [Exophiala sideris]KAK5186575.1 hypothetical protein LTR44_001632 [Eurotiomycetes sp. CCFEE 6388]